MNKLLIQTLVGFCVIISLFFARSYQLEQKIKKTQLVPTSVPQKETQVETNSLAALTVFPHPSPSLVSPPTIEKTEVTADAWKVEKVNEHLTRTGFPADERMATPEELFIAVNEFRKAHKVNELQKHSTACSIAQSRADQLFLLGKVDEHAGLTPMFNAQSDFSFMAETIINTHQPSLAVHIVEFGWNRSLTGHREALLDPKWQYGCGGIKGFFAAFILAAN